MKESNIIKRLIIIVVFIGLLASCHDPAGNNSNNKPDEPNNPDKKTYIQFDNTQGICAVSVYKNSLRREEDKIDKIPAGGKSEKIEWTSGTYVPFYYSYSINLKGINGFTIDNYKPEPEFDQNAVRIDADTTTIIKIPTLDETISSPDKLLSNKSYLLIQNNSSFSFELHRGASTISPDNLPEPLVNSGERAQYTITPGTASIYKLLIGWEYKEFSSSIVNFEEGHVYSFIFDSNITLITEIEIILKNIADSSSNSSIPETPGAPVIMASDSLFTLQWITVNRAENYEVYLSTTQQPPASPAKTVAGTTTVLTGLTNKTAYYIWIKAINSSGSSDFSPYSRGIPWPNNEVPAVPGTPVIIPGINQLTINWEECGGAVSYEVYINTSATKPSAPEISTDKTSAVIKNLENEKIYYIWVRAVNSTGKSNYSPLEAGTPKIPTNAPSSPARPVLTAGNHELTVSWQPVELTAAYEVWYGTTNNSAQAQKYGGDIEESVTKTIITGLVNETTYYVWIKAKNLIGSSGFSPSANAKPSAFAVLPDTPALPTVTPGSRTLNVSWTQVEGALSYEVWTGTTNNPASAQKYGADVTGTSVTLTGFTNDTTYYLWIKSKNNIGVSVFSPMASGTPSAFAATPPAPQSAPTLTAGSGQLTVNWQAVEGATAYEVWAGTSSNPTIATKRGDDVAGLSSVITGLTNGTTYYVWIKAKNTVGTSNFSPMVSGTPSAFLGVPQSPSAPSISVGNGQITVTWTAVEGATAYEVWMGAVNNSASATKNGADITSSLSSTISSLTNGTTYYFWIKAKNSYGTSGFSAAASGKPLGTPGIPTLTPAPNQLLITWTAVAGADEYEVYYGIGTPTILALTTTDTTTTISGLTNGTTYFVRLRAKNASGTSDYGAIESKIPGKSPGLYRGTNKIGTQNLSDSLTYILSNAATGDEYYIVLGSDESVSPKPLSYSGKTVKITLLGSGIERTLSLNTSGSMFTVNSGVTLTLDENISLVGLSTNNAALVYVYGGDLIMNNSSKISGNINTSSNGNGGGVYLGNGTFTMNGGTISENTTSPRGGGGGVYLYSGTFTMNGGLITGNTTSSSGGGGVFVSTSGNFIMNGGKITKNEDKSGYGGGGIIVMGGTFTMNGGTISGNSADRFGGGVYVYSSGNFTMYGGIISGNTAKEGGGGVDSSHGIFKKLPQSGGQNSGIIYGAEAVGVDSDGLQLKNFISNSRASAVYGPSSLCRNTTIGETDQIDTTTGKGLSANGNPPFGQ